MLRSSRHFPIQLSKISHISLPWLLTFCTNRFAKVMSHVTKTSLVVKEMLTHARQEMRQISGEISVLLAVRGLC